MRLLKILLVVMTATVGADSAGSLGGRAVGNLSGVNLRLTLVHEEGYVNMLGDDGLLLPVEEWSGFLIDMLQRVSEHSGLNYTLLSPSGNSSYCTPSNLTGAERAAFYATQYNCGQGDAELNATDVLWGMYYMTRFRMERGITFTVPFAADKGLSMLASSATPPTYYDEAVKIFRPFTPLAWFLSLVSAFLFAGLMWLMEAGHSRRESQQREESQNVYEKAPPEYNHSKEDWQQYWGSDVNRTNTWGMYKTMYSSMQTLLAHALPEVATKAGFVYTWIFSFYAVVWIAAYTANLAAILTTPTKTVTFKSISELMVAQQSGQVGPACVKQGTAYVTWLEVNFPRLKLSKLPKTGLGIAKDVATKTCDVMIDASPQIEYVQASECQLNLVIPGQPLSFGVTDMAIGVRGGLDSHVLDGITYWVQSLKQCARNDRSRHCYGRENIAAMYDVYTKSACPGTGAISKNAVRSLSARSFSLFYALIIVVGVLLVITSKKKSPLVRYWNYSLSSRWKKCIAALTKPLRCCRSEATAAVADETINDFHQLGELIADVILQIGTSHGAERRSQLVSRLITVINPGRKPSPELQRELASYKKLLDYLFPSLNDDDDEKMHDALSRVRVTVSRSQSSGKENKQFRKLQNNIFDALEAYYMRFHVESWMYLMELRAQLEKKYEHIANVMKRGLKSNTRGSQQQICKAAIVTHSPYARAYSVFY